MPSTYMCNNPYLNIFMPICTTCLDYIFSFLVLISIFIHFIFQFPIFRHFNFLFSVFIHLSFQFLIFMHFSFEYSDISIFKISNSLWTFHKKISNFKFHFSIFNFLLSISTHPNSNISNFKFSNSKCFT